MGPSMHPVNVPVLSQTLPSSLLIGVSHPISVRTVKHGTLLVSKNLLLVTKNLVPRAEPITEQIGVPNHGVTLLLITPVTHPQLIRFCLRIQSSRPSSLQQQHVALTRVVNAFPLWKVTVQLLVYDSSTLLLQQRNTWRKLMPFSARCMQLNRVSFHTLEH